jgi:hypothetical protein
MSKISQYAQDTAPSTDDYLIGVDAAGPTTKRYLLSDLITLFLNSIPATEGSFGFVSSGLVWTADAAGSTRLASMTSGRIRVNTTFLAIAAVTSRTFTASKDTYIDILDNLDGTGTIVYTEVTNNAASPALASNSVRIGIIVTGATTIASTGSVNQGEETKVLPIASSIAYSVTDSIGNLICPRDAARRTLGYRQIIGAYSTATTTDLQVTGVSAPVKIPAGRKAKAFSAIDLSGGTANVNYTIALWNGTVGSGTQINAGSYFQQQGVTANAGGKQSAAAEGPIAAAVAEQSITINLGTRMSGAATIALNTSATTPAFVRIELC